MFPTSSRLSHKFPPSSRAWLRRQFNDPYVRQRLCHPSGYRSRSAFKLIELHNNWGRFLNHNDVKNVVDLGAAPGGWSQVVAGKLGWSDGRNDSLGRNHRNKLQKRAKGEGWGLSRKKKLESMGMWSSAEERLVDETPEDNQPTGRGQVIAVDLLRMDSIPGVQTLQVDFLSDEASVLIKGLLLSEDNPDGKADVILSDMAANMSGHMIRDSESSVIICEAVMRFAMANLRTARSIGRKDGGVLLLKHFAHPLTHEFRMEVLKPAFHSVMYCKPDSSRSESSEGYWLCQGFKGNGS